MLIFCAVVFFALVAVLVFMNRAHGQAPKVAVAPNPNPQPPVMSNSTPTNPTNTASPKPSESELRQSSTKQQYYVTQQCGTEPAFQNEFWNNHKAGLYVDIVSGEPLFTSVDKFDSGSGWPSFTKPVAKDHVTEKSDNSHGMIRTEVRSHKSGSHLGHVFDDGPGPTGLRYCINSAALRFVPVEKLQEEGYGEFLPLFPKASPEKSPASDKK